MIDLDALIVGMLFFIQLFFKVSAYRNRIFFIPRGGNAAAAAFNGAFGENIADCHAEDDKDKDTESKEEEVFMCIPRG